MVKISSFAAFISIVFTLPVFANEFIIFDNLKKLESGIKNEMGAIPPLEIISASESDPSEHSHSILTRAPKNKLRDLPGFIQKPLYESWADFLNLSLRKLRLTEFINYYDKYTRVSINFGVEEFLDMSAAEKRVEVRTELANFQLPTRKETQLTLKFDPKGIGPSGKMSNLSMVLEHKINRSRYKLQYSTWEGIKLLIERDGIILAGKPLAIAGEYIDSQKEFNFWAMCDLGQNWRLKLNAEFYPDNREQKILLTFFVPIKF